MRYSQLKSFWKIWGMRLLCRTDRLRKHSTREFCTVPNLYVSKYVISQGIVFNETSFEFTALDENNIFNYDDIASIKINKDTKASLKKNFNDRQSQIIIEEKDGKVTTVDIGLTSMKKLKKIENEILSHINEN